MDGSVVSQYDNVSCENFISLHCLQSLCVCVSEHVLLIAVPRLQDTPGGGVGAQGDQTWVVTVPSGGRERWGDSHA